MTDDGLQPFLRWAGSKRWLVPELKQIVPKSFGDYYEPFLGSGALYLSLPSQHKCYLSDLLEPLIHCYRSVQANPEEVSVAASLWATDSDTYYTVRGSTFSDPITRAAQFIYLNKLCFNGLYRENQSGQFNVPYGRPKSTRVLFDGHLKRVSAHLATAELRVADFADAVDDAKAGDFVYLDPPYAAGHRTNGFVDYNSKIFSWDDQRRLAAIFTERSQRGVHVVVSNADHSSVRDLYRGFNTKSVERYSSMSASSSRRGRSAELLIVSESLAVGTVG